MGQFSRVKKYEQLRNEIEQNKDVKSEIESSIFDVTKPQEDKKTYTPIHEKESFFKEKDNTNDLDSTFKNEYLDSFIQEVRDYNIKKGVREHEDTRLDILQQLSSKNRDRRSNYVESIQEAPRDLSNETIEISKQVLGLLNEEKNAENNSSDDVLPIPSFHDVTTFVEEEEMVQQETEEMMAINADTDRMNSKLESRIAMLESQLVETTQQLKRQTFEENYEDDFTAFSKRELIEETQKLKVQMDEYKDELEDLNSDVNSNNRLLNVVITILIIALLGVIGVVVYWLVSGGII